VYQVKYWTGSGSNKSNKWELFEEYGTSPAAYKLAANSADKLAELFSAVEIHFIREGSPTIIERITS